jgi:hypothetical protein
LLLCRPLRWIGALDNDPSPAFPEERPQSGKELRRISEKIVASGEKPLTRRELEREIANRRTGDF